MTRETKIGLLVGLAFIIVIGILLSDHLTSSTEPPQAALAGAGSNVRSGVTVPGQPTPQPAAQAAPNNPAPSQMVPTRDELTPPANPVSIVRVGPAANTNQPAASTAAPPNPEPAVSQVASNEQPTTPGTEAPTITRMPTDTATPATPIANVAKQHGEELVLLDNNGRAVRGKTQARGAMAEYKAEPGDSLSKMALKLMGANTKANRDAIMAANPFMKNDPNKVIVGRTYMIPTSTESTAAVINNAPAPAPTQTHAPAPSTPPETASNAPDTGEYWYTVKPGDSLWKIATEQCGRAGAIAAIKELNQESLRGDNKDQVFAGMKLRLPSKPIARAN